MSERQMTERDIATPATLILHTGADDGSATEGADG